MKFGDYFDQEQEKARRLRELKKAQQNALYSNAAELIAEMEEIFDWYYDVANNAFDEITNQGVRPTSDTVKLDFSPCYPHRIKVDLYNAGTCYDFESASLNTIGYENYLGTTYVNCYDSKFDTALKIFDILQVKLMTGYKRYPNPHSHIYVQLSRKRDGSCFFELHVVYVKTEGINILRKLTHDTYTTDNGSHSDSSYYESTLWYKLWKYNAYNASEIEYVFVRKIYNPDEFTLDYGNLDDFD